MKKTRNNPEQLRHQREAELMLIEEPNISDRYRASKKRSKHWIAFTVILISIVVIVALAIIIFLVVDPLPPTLTAA